MATQDNQSTLPPNEETGVGVDVSIEDDSLLPDRTKDRTKTRPGDDGTPPPTGGGDTGRPPGVGIDQITGGTTAGGGYVNVPGSPGIGDPSAPALLGPAGDTTIGKAAQREVGEQELVANQLTGLLAGDSKYMRQARQEGLELGGGLGGTSGIRAAMGEAIRRGLPIAMADAQAYRDAAAQNMDALNQFGLANIQRQTQIELGIMDSNTRVQTTHMNNMTQTAIARLQDITARDISKADNETKLRITNINGEIQKSLAEAQFRYSQVLNDQEHAARLEEGALVGEYNLEAEAARNAAMQQTTYVDAYMQSYDGTLDRIQALNGLDIDEAARRRAEDAIWEGFYGQVDLLERLYPDAEPIQWEGQ